jgi:hypothetical protein
MTMTNAAETLQVVRTNRGGGRCACGEQMIGPGQRCAKVEDRWHRTSDFGTCDLSPADLLSSMPKAQSRFERMVVMNKASRILRTAAERETTDLVLRSHYERGAQVLRAEHDRIAGLYDATEIATALEGVIGEITMTLGVDVRFKPAALAAIGNLPMDLARHLASET